MAGGATCKTEIYTARLRQGGQMTGEAVLPKSLHIRIGFLGWIESRQGGDAAGTAGHLNGKYPQAGCQVGLDAEGEQNAGDGTGVSGLDAGGGALNVVAVTFRGATVAFVASTGGLNDREIRGIATAAHGAVSQVCIQSQWLAAMTEHAAEGLDRMRVADLGQVRVAGEAVFHLTGESGGERNRLRVEVFIPSNKEQSQQESE